jgi:hypothetical protein
MVATGKLTFHISTPAPVVQVTFSPFLLIADIIAERRWDESFAASQETLRKLGQAALEDYHAGKTEPLDPDHL